MEGINVKLHECLTRRIRTCFKISVQVRQHFLETDRVDLSFRLNCLSLKLQIKLQRFCADRKTPKIQPLTLQIPLEHIHTCQK